MSLRPFRTMPKDEVEWARWCTEQTNPTSIPPSGMHKVTNIYWNPTTEAVVVEYETDPAD